MAFKIAEAFVSIRVHTFALADQLRTSQKMISKAVGKMGLIAGRLVGAAVGAALNAVKRLAKISAAAFVGLGIASLKFASDAEETRNLFVVSMKDMAGAAQQFAKQYSDALGLDIVQTQKFLGTMNVMLTSMGLTSQEAFGMSKAMTALAFDMSSFFNIKPEEAFQKLQAGITGEVEPLKRLGVLVSATRVEMFALEKGIIQEGEALTENQKIMARFGLIMESTRDAQGDLGNTMGSLANVTRRFGVAVKVLLTQIGKLFTEDVAASMEGLIQKLQNATPAILEFVTNIKAAIAGWIKEQGGLAGMWDKLLEAFKKIKKYVVTELLPPMRELGNLILLAGKGVAAVAGFIGGTKAIRKQITQASGMTGAAMALTGGGYLIDKMTSNI